MFQPTYYRLNVIMPYVRGRYRSISQGYCLQTTGAGGVNSRQDYGYYVIHGRCLIVCVKRCMIL